MKMAALRALHDLELGYPPMLWINRWVTMKRTKLESKIAMVD
jgi:hypothetical protein